MNAWVDPPEMPYSIASFQGNIQHPVSGIRYRVSRAMDERSTA
jgi:hypothetical protein